MEVSYRKLGRLRVLSVLGIGLVSSIICGCDYSSQNNNLLELKYKPQIKMNLVSGEIRCEDRDNLLEEIVYNLNQSSLLCSRN